MDAPTLDRLLTDSLLLDAIEGFDSIAARLADLHDRLDGREDREVGVLREVLTDLGWWTGRFQGALSPDTVEAIQRLSDGT